LVVPTFSCFIVLIYSFVRLSVSHSFLLFFFSPPTMSSFVRVAGVSDIPDPGRELVEVEEQLIVLLHVGGEFFALDDVCTHDGGPLSEGEIDDHTIACPRHGAKFDLCTGAALTMPATQPTRTHEVKVEGGDVWVRLRD